jgi:hypothetical protein
VAGPTHHVEAWILLKRPASDTFQSFTVYTAENGAFLALQRLSRKSTPVAALDLFDHAALLVEEPAQGQAWFIKEIRLITRHSEIGRSYDTLRFASRFASLVAQNPVGEESRATVAELLKRTFAAFAAAARPDIVYLKALYMFCRDEGYPLKQEWFPELTTTERALVAELLNRPLAEQTTDPKTVARLQRRLDDYLRGNTEIMLEEARMTKHE